MDGKAYQDLNLRVGRSRDQVLQRAYFPCIYVCNKYLFYFISLKHWGSQSITQICVSVSACACAYVHVRVCV